MPSREEPRLTHRLRDPKGVSIRGSMQAHVLGLALLLVELAWSAGSQPAAHPDIEILSPLPDQPATLPLHVRFRLSAAGRAIVAVDGFVAQSFSLTEETGLEASISLSHLSLERHLFSIDLLAPDDSLLFQGPRWEVEIVDHAAPAVDDGDSTAGREDETAGWEVEPCESFDPDMTEEERGRAEELDGWLLVREHIDFTTLEPTDSCEDAGWVTRARPRRVWDTFQFFNELDILELRLHELNSTVHRFVVVEATRTHSNQPKPLHYLLNAARFLPFKDKIIHIVVDDLPSNGDAWARENFQRNAMARGLALAHPNDLAVISDVDEIPMPYILDLLRRCDGPSSPAWLYSRFFNFRFDLEFAGQWRHPQVIRVAQLDRGDGQGGVLPQRVRMGRMRPHHTKIESAGWHVSFFTDERGVMDKVRAFTHQELNRADWLDPTAIRAAMASGADYFNADSKGNRNAQERHGGLHSNPSCHGLPYHALAHPEVYGHLLPDCAAAHGEDLDLRLLAFPLPGAVPTPPRDHHREL